MSHSFISRPLSPPTVRRRARDSFLSPNIGSPRHRVCPARERIESTYRGHLPPHRMQHPASTRSNDFKSLISTHKRVARASRRVAFRGRPLASRSIRNPIPVFARVVSRGVARVSSRSTHLDLGSLFFFGAHRSLARFGASRRGERGKDGVVGARDGVERSKSVLMAILGMRYLRALRREHAVEARREDVGWGVNWDFGIFEVGHAVGDLRRRRVCFEAKDEVAVGGCAFRLAERE